MIGVTRLVKAGGPLTKRIYIDETNKLVSDGSACVMSHGFAERVRAKRLNDVADLIEGLATHEAIALGNLQADLPDRVEVITQNRLAELNGSGRSDQIARNARFITYEAGQAALALIDVDTKGMPDEVLARIKEHGGFWDALVSVSPALATAARIVRRSTTTGLTRADTGETFAGSCGMHFYLHVQDGTDVKRFLNNLHDRCWLAGLGWYTVGAGGQLLSRSLVDRTVCAAERLVFEGAPVLAYPLVQDQASRKPQVHAGAIIDTLETGPPLRIVELSRLKARQEQSARALAPRQAEVRERFINHQSTRLAQSARITNPAARRVIERQCEGILLPDLLLPWDDDEMVGCTVGDVLADPSRFVGATLADPLEGPTYGRTKAKVMRSADGLLWINSFAHGRTFYRLRYDARAAAATLTAAPHNQVADTFVHVVVNGDLDADEVEAMRNQAYKLSGVSKQALGTKLKAAKKVQEDRASKEANDRRSAERIDPRPQIRAPALDAPWLPEMEALNDVLGSSGEAEPPMRDIDGAVTQIHVRRIPNMHALTAQGANEGNTHEMRLPASEQPLLTRLDESSVAELIERYIDYTDRNGRSIHYPMAFVRHFMTRNDNALPVVAAVATLPIVAADGSLLSKPGLDRERCIVMRVPPELLAVIPAVETCTEAAVAKAVRFLFDEWLCDVATDYAGKCILIAAAMTIIERSVLPERPAFFVTAGRRGGGKTTALIMLLVAVTGIRPSAAAWSPDEEERRKSLLSYLLGALPAIIWDNIPRGSNIACPHIEKSCTTAFCSDRRLGVSEVVAVSASVVHLFTGNNIAPRGDLASRSLQVRLEVDRADPENREFRHSDPIVWTEVNRGKILQALYVILLGNPALKPSSNVAPQTRFKGWWRLVGSAIEHASRCHSEDMIQRIAAMVDDPPAQSPVIINFRDLFLSQEEDDEESASLADALQALDAQFPQSRPFQASDLTRLLNDQSNFKSNDEQQRAATLREFLFPQLPASQIITAKSAGKRLRRHHGEPVRVDGRTLLLREWRDSHVGPNGTLSYRVEQR